MRRRWSANSPPLPVVTMTPRQRASLDGRLRDRLEPRSIRRLHIRPRGIAVVLASLFVAAPAVFVVSAALRSTESPNGLASATFQAEIDAAKKVVPPGRRHLATLPHRERPER